MDRASSGREGDEVIVHLSVEAEVMSSICRTLTRAAVACAVTAATCSALQAQTTDDIGLRLRLSVTSFDEQAQTGTWLATAEINDPTDMTLGLDSLAIEVRGGGGAEITGADLLLPQETIDGFQRGFYDFRSSGQDSGADWTGIQGAQPLDIVQQDGMYNVLTGVGEGAAVNVAQGDFSLSDGGGWLELVTTENLNTVLPAGPLAPNDRQNRSSVTNIETHMLLVGAETLGDLTYTGMVSVAGFGSSIAAGNVDLTGRLEVADGGTLHVDNLTITPNVALLAEQSLVAGGGVLSVTGADIDQTLRIEGDMLIYADSGLTTTLGHLSIGSTGQVTLTSTPLTAPQIERLMTGASIDEVLAVPEPASALVLTLGALAALGRRRRR
jgi:hypothetical protein